MEMGVTERRHQGKGNGSTCKNKPSGVIVEMDRRRDIFSSMLRMGTPSQLREVLQNHRRRLSKKLPNQNHLQPTERTSCFCGTKAEDKKWTKSGEATRCQDSKTVTRCRKRPARREEKD
jgi:hypothetical protein